MPAADFHRLDVMIVEPYPIEPGRLLSKKRANRRAAGGDKFAQAC